MEEEGERERRDWEAVEEKKGLYNEEGRKQPRGLKLAELN